LNSWLTDWGNGTIREFRAPIHPAGKSPFTALNPEALFWLSRYTKTIESLVGTFTAYWEIKMISTGKCPKCESIVTRVNLESLDVYVGMQNQWKGVSYLCPYCRTVLCVGIDPVALKIDTANDLLKALGK
jgi:hypothetical protein